MLTNYQNEIACLEQAYLNDLELTRLEQAFTVIEQTLDALIAALNGKGLAS